ncbi:MAG: demethylmenaquinone methyltransferase / 2-methoxy-6-polyprenyl,4-benzoquinol methylase [Desulfonauticus sp.]|nr:demethylmenaquinone methyltransferase / 2-methoxy-6-polyprenyl,4-benzoquinol methylase [Desulfonauticus sp.]
MDKHLQNKTPVDRLFASIATNYDFLNHFLSLGVDFYWRRRLVQSIDPFPGMRVLDLACGTYDVGLALVNKEARIRVMGVDYTFQMLVAGKKKLSKVGRKICPLQGDGRFLPFKDNSFDVVSIAFGIRNINPRERAYKEILRVLKPGGRFFILEFGSGRQRIWKGLYNFYLTKILPLIGGFFSQDRPAYEYLARTVKEFPLASDLARELKLAGFGKIDYFPLTSGIVYIHKGEKLTSG